jgi:hypothetical protein
MRSHGVEISHFSELLENISCGLSGSGQEIAAKCTRGTDNVRVCSRSHRDALGTFKFEMALWSQEATMQIESFSIEQLERRELVIALNRACAFLNAHGTPKRRLL